MRAGTAMVSIHIIQGPDQGRTVQVSGTEATIGRQSETLRLSDGTVSRQHARLTQRDGEWSIEDTGSVNGTFLNSVKITRASRVHVGDQIRCGRTLLVFGGRGDTRTPPLDVGEDGGFLEASIMASVPASDDSVIIPTPEAGAEAIENLRVIYNLTTEISSIFNLDQLAERTLELVYDLMQPQRAYLLLFGRDGQLLPMAARDNNESAGEAMPISRTIINEVVEKQVGILSSNAMRDKRFSSGKSVHDYGIRSAICVPIKGRETILGVIHVDSSVADQTYSTEQLRLLTAIGYQTGLAIENVRLHEATVKSERLAAVGETVAALSHHIKNILQALGGGSDIVEKALTRANVGRAKQAWPLIRRNLDRINAVILNMLAYSKPGQTLQQTVDLNRVLSECVELLTPQADEARVALITDLGELPPLHADPGGLHQAFLNLLTNALDAVKPDEGVVTVSSAFDPLTRSISVRVADNGVGIPPQEIDKIFEVFHTTKGHKGTGLGLAVTRKVIREHRGRIAVESTLGTGTSFTVTVPIQPASASALDETSAP
jgi:two-component system NtrC family sensor kinase